MKCVDCGNPCRNKCSGCRRPYCAYCRDISGFLTCAKYCRAKQVRKAQQAKAAQKAAQQAQIAKQAPAYTPPPQLAQYANVAPGVQGMTPPTKLSATVARPAQRKMLSLMTEQEFKAWQQRTISALEDAKARGEAYLQRRTQRGTRTSTDIGMERDQVLFADLLMAMEEIETLWEWAQRGQGQGQSQTGMMVEYDDQQQGKLQP